MWWGGSAAEGVGWAVYCDGEDWEGSRASLGWLAAFSWGRKDSRWQRMETSGCAGLTCMQLYVEMCTTTW